MSRPLDLTSRSSSICSYGEILASGSGMLAVRGESSVTKNVFGS